MTSQRQPESTLKPQNTSKVSPQDVALIETKLARRDAQVQQQRKHGSLAKSKDPEPDRVAVLNSDPVSDSGLAMRMEGLVEQSQRVVGEGSHRKVIEQSGTLHAGTNDEHRIIAQNRPDHRTRSSVRRNIGQKHRRTPSPSPVMDRWTNNTPNWMHDIGWTTSLVYPQVGKKRAIVDARDIERLDEGEYLNDNLISFYLRYLEHDIEQNQPDLTRRIYFQNTFFYEGLTKPVKGKSGINYDGVARWTAKVDIFSYDYIVVPVNENAHWYVAIICNVPKLRRSKPAEEYPKADRFDDDVGQRPALTSKEADTLEKPAAPVEIAEFTTSVSSTAAETSPLTTAAESLEGLSVEASTAEEATYGDGSDHEMRVPRSVADNDSAGDWPDCDLNPLPPHIGHETNKAALLPLTSSREDMDDGTEDTEMKEAPISASAHGRPSTNSNLKKSKRKSLVGRRVNINSPIVITLDSLGGDHAATRRNLKDYLLREAEAKLNLKISIGDIQGCNAANIPEQNNFCDCGLFLLGYIQKFTENPDLFIKSIMRGPDVPKIRWAGTDPPFLRNHIRELIFKLEAEQKLANEQKQKEKKREKKAGKKHVAETTSSQPESPSVVAVAEPSNKVASPEKPSQNHDHMSPRSSRLQRPVARAASVVLDEPRSPATSRSSPISRPGSTCGRRGLVNGVLKVASKLIPSIMQEPMAANLLDHGNGHAIDTRTSSTGVDEFFSQTAHVTRSKPEMVCEGIRSRIMEIPDSRPASPQAQPPNQHGFLDFMDDARGFMEGAATEQHELPDVETPSGPIEADQLLNTLDEWRAAGRHSDKQYIHTSPTTTPPPSDTVRMRDGLRMSNRRKMKSKQSAELDVVTLDE